MKISILVVIKLKTKTSKKMDQKLRKRLRSQEMKYEDMVTILVTSGANDKLKDLLSKLNLNLEFKDSDGNTPINIASQNGYFK